MSPSSYHTPVLVAPLLSAVGRPARAVDATLGDGGHAEALLATGAEVLGIDRDPDAIGTARNRLGESRIHYLEAPYASDEALAAVAAFRPDLVLLDLGVSSRQLDQDARGFSFRLGAPLDMRMGPTGPTAAEWLNRTDETVLAQVFADWADERRARRLAAELGRRRARQPLAVSDDLVNAIRAVLGARSGPADFARIFQAVRIAVNDELEGLEHALPAFRDALVPDGRLAVISYHSGEDRVVKHAFQDWSRRCICPPLQPVCTCRGRPLGRAEPRKPILADVSEVAANPRARSAKLRIFRVSDEG
jgi:16S rRNA (cytosine1402-N4)-methyltransferase